MERNFLEEEKLQMTSSNPVYTIYGPIDCEDIKRCHVGGAILKTPCPACNTPYIWNLEEDHIEYPVHNVWMGGFQFSCDHCGNVWGVQVKFQAVAKIEVRNE